jgi:hypothetical protein
MFVIVRGKVSLDFGVDSALGFGVVKEFLPDLGRAITNKRKKRSAHLSHCSQLSGPTELSPNVN